MLEMFHAKKLAEENLTYLEKKLSFEYKQSHAPPPLIDVH